MYRGSVSSYAPGMEAITQIIPKLRSVKSTPGYSLANTDELPCALFVANTPVQVDSVTKRPMVVAMTLPDPPIDWADFLGSLFAHAGKMSAQAATGNVLPAIIYGATVALPDIVRKLRNPQQQEESQQMDSTSEQAFKLRSEVEDVTEIVETRDVYIGYT